jgi:hypothetical protein
MTPKEKQIFRNIVKHLESEMCCHCEHDWQIEGGSHKQDLFLP